MAKESRFAADIGAAIAGGAACYVRLHTGEPEHGPDWTPVSGEGWTVTFVPGIVLRSGESLVIARGTQEATAG